LDFKNLPRVFEIVKNILPMATGVPTTMHRSTSSFLGSSFSASLSIVLLVTIGCRRGGIVEGVELSWVELIIEVEVEKVVLTRTGVEVGKIEMSVETGNIVNGREELVVEVLLKVKSEEFVELGKVGVLTVRRVVVVVLTVEVRRVDKTAILMLLATVETVLVVVGVETDV
jgi:hypothetical protein